MEMVDTKKLFNLLGEFTGKLAAVDTESETQLERYDVAVLVCELGSLRSLLTNREVASVEQILDRFYDAVSAAVHRSNGDVQNMFQGKCYCVFGAPGRLDNPGEMAEQAAALLKAAWQGVSLGDESPLPLRLAVQTGELHCGVFGTAGKQSFEGLGDVYERANDQLGQLAYS